MNEDPGDELLSLGAEAELVVETLYADETGEREIWRWKPVTGANA